MTETELIEDAIAVGRSDPPVPPTSEIFRACMSLLEMLMEQGPLPPRERANFWVAMARTISDDSRIEDSTFGLAFYRVVDALRATTGVANE